MYFHASDTYLIHNFPSLACSLTPLTHTYFIFFFSRMCSLTSGTYLFHLFSFLACILTPLAHTQSIISPSLACISLPPAHSYFIFFLFSHVFSRLWHIPISSFFSFRMYSLASGTYLIHNFTLSSMYLLASDTYLIHNFSSLACIPLPLAHSYFIFFLFSHVFPCLWHIPNP